MGQQHLLFLNMIMLNSSGLCVLLKEKHKILFLNLGKFSYGEKQCSAPMEWDLMKSRFSVKFMRFSEENGTCCDWQVFFFISERFEDFLNLRLSLIVPLRTIYETLSFILNFFNFLSFSGENLPKSLKEWSGLVPWTVGMTTLCVQPKESRGTPHSRFTPL